MSDEATVSRRHFLTVATTATGVVGVGLFAAPFLASFKPSTGHRPSAPVEVDISKLEPGADERTGAPAVWVLPDA